MRQAVGSESDVRSFYCRHRMSLCLSIVLLTSFAAGCSPYALYRKEARETVRPPQPLHVAETDAMAPQG